MNIQEFRQEYPQYNDLGDQDLADKLHAKYYSDLPKQDFYQRFGLNSANSPAISPNSSPIQPSSGSALSNFGLGALGAVRNFGQDIADIPPALAPSIFPKGQLPQVPRAQGIAGTLGNVAGNIGTFMGGGEALDAARGAAEAIPMAGRAFSALGSSNFLPSLARRAAGSGIYGAITSPQNPGTGAAENAGISTGLDLLGGAPKVYGALAQYVKPNQYAKQLIGSLSPGQNLEENAKSLSQDIENAYKKHQGAASDLYSPVFNRVGNSSIYDPLTDATTTKSTSNNFDNINDVINHLNDKNNTELKTPSDLKDYLLNNHGVSFKNNKQILDFFNSGRHDIPASSKYISLNPSIADNYNYDLKDLHQQFIKNPTFQNAHNLQAQLGSSIRDLQKTRSKSGLTSADSSVLQGNIAAKTALNSDMNNFLGNSNQNLSDQYQQANKYFINNVVPYRESPQLSQIANGTLTNPKNIGNLFKSPSDNTLKVIDDLGDSGRNKVLYSQLGNINKPEKLLDALQKLPNKGFSSYITPQVSQGIEPLANRIMARNLAQRVSGGALGAALAHASGSGMLGMDVLGATLGGLANPTVMGAISKALPLDTIAKGASAVGRTTYPTLTKAILANNIQSNQQ
jgi:hypothetical protein